MYIYGSVSVLLGGGALGSSGERGLEVSAKLISVTEHTASMRDVINHGGTSLISNCPPPMTTVGPQACSCFRVLGGGLFLMSEVHLQRPVGYSHRRGYEPGLLPGTREYRSSRFHLDRGGGLGS